MSESTPNGPNPSASSSSIFCVLPDGTTFDYAEGCMLAAVPDEIFSDDMESFLKEGDYPKMRLTEIDDPADILRFFRLFFPNMEVNTDSEGQIIIHTGLYPNGEPNDV